MVRQLAYHSGLSLEEAKKRYREVRDELEKIKKCYSGFFGRFRRNMSKKDQEVLVDCIGVLLPLSLESSVLEQVKQTEKYEDTLYYRIQRVQLEIIDYLANFKNIGVEGLKGRLEDEIIDYLVNFKNIGVEGLKGS